MVSFNAFSQEKKVNLYPFNSAIIEYKYEASFGGTHIRYIDDYGYKQTDIIRRELNFGGHKEQEYETVILIGEKAYTINWQDSTVAVGRNETYTYYLQNQGKSGTQITEAIFRSANDYVLTGTESYLKKDCKSWQSDKSKMLTWNGLMLKSETNLFVMMVEKAVKIKIDKKLPKGIFDIPTGLKYISADVYQGFSGLELVFDKPGSEQNSNKNSIDISFNTNDLGGTSNFIYSTVNGKSIVTEGMNDYNKIDYHLIKSQAYGMQGTPVSLNKSRVLVFITQAGEFGKLQISELEHGKYSLRYVLFNKEGLILKYADRTSEGLQDFDIRVNKDSKLIISPKGKAGCFVLGW